MAIAGVGGVGGAGSVSQLAQLYRQQVIGAGQPGSTGGAQTATQGAGSPAAGRGADFGSAIANSISSLEGLDQTAASKAVKAATGDLTDIHDYVIAATQAQTATELTTTVRNKALDAFNEIMRMPL
jgi:flagellar hook-basal body complex protein FliE